MVFDMMWRLKGTDFSFLVFLGMGQLSSLSVIVAQENTGGKWVEKDQTCLERGKEDICTSKLQTGWAYLLQFGIMYVLLHNFTRI